MFNSIKRIFPAFCIVALLANACAKWVDVKPSIEVRSELIFAKEQTVQEALNGVYGAMGRAQGYGRNMTWGFVDAIAGVYDLSKLESYEVDAFGGNYNNTQTEDVIAALWNNTYNAIANANNLIDGIEKADPEIFTGNNKNVIHGEALGLRAMMHFDLLRLFGARVGSAGWSQPTIPYVKEYTSNITERSSGPDVIEQILDDLAVAERLLSVDYIRNDNGTDLLRGRKVRLNYYAIKALQARVYMWINDLPKALEAATAVIEVANEKFAWTGFNGMTDLVTFSGFDYIFSSENIFSLYSNNLRNYIEGKLINIATTGTLLPALATHYSLSESMRQEAYEAGGAGATDFRSTYMIGLEIKGGNLSTLVYKKIHQTSEGPSGRTRPFTRAENRLPMIKVAEMFYIASECLADTHPDQAIAYLNTVRTNRGIPIPLSPNLSATDIRAEIRKEYRKEFPCEGQYFYFLKRTGELNRILPIPKRELEYGF